MRIILLLSLLLSVWASACVAQKTEGSITLGYEYLNAETKTGGRNALDGWHGVLEKNLSKHVGVYADSANFYAAPENVHSLTGGLLYKLKKFHKVTPQLFTELGESRNSAPSTGITYAFEYALGASFTYPLNKHLSIEACPAEYVLTLPNGSARNNYVAHAGFVIPFGHKNPKK